MQVTTERVVYGALVVVTLIGVVLRISYINGPMAWDEALIAEWTHSWGFLRIAADYSNPGNHILYHLVVAVIAMIFGPEPWSLRLPALIPGIALIPATFLVVSALLSRGTALITAGLVAGSPFLTVYSVESRGYMLQCLLVMLLLWLLMRLAEYPSRRLTLAAGTVGGLAMYTLPTTILVLPGLYVGAALWVRRGTSPFQQWATESTDRLLPALLITGGLSLTLYLPVLMANGWDAIITNNVIAAQSAPLLWDRFEQVVLDTADRWTWSLPVPVQALCALGAGIGVLDMARRRTSSGLLVVLVIITPFVVSLALQRVAFYRSYLFLMPFFLMALAAGIRSVMERLPINTSLACPLIAVLLATSGTIWTWSDGWLRTDPVNNSPRIIGAESAAKALANAMRRGVSVLPAFPHMRYYSRLHDLGLRFRGVSEGHDTVYWLVREPREALRESIERNGFADVLREEFEEPRLFGAFSDLKIFVLHRKPVSGNGWYPEETAAGSTWRWTGETASLSFRAQTEDAALYLDYAARPDLVAGAPQVVTISAGDLVLQSFVADEAGRRRLRIPLPPTATGNFMARSWTPTALNLRIPLPSTAADNGYWTEIEIRVDPTFVPANAITGSRDARELGIQVYHVGPFPPPS